MSDAVRPTTPISSGDGYVELVERLNRDWHIAGVPPAGGSLPRRLLYRLRLVIARLIGPQETFNAAVVQFVNTIEPVLAALDEVARHREALAARERRMEAGMERIRAEHEELRTSMAVLRQANHDLMRELARRETAPGAAAGTGAGVPVSSGAAADATAAARDSAATPAPKAGGAATGATSSEALSHKYVGFEDAFRGSAADIRERQAGYVDIFAGTSDVLDIGCGRGEFLALLKERGVTARGIDVNESMIEVCRQHGLDATRADALAYLRAQPPASLGGLIAAQVVEHLDPGYLTNLLDAACTALRPGAPIVLETINPACWFAFFESYVRDITHVRPLHPDTLKFLLLASGFAGVEIRYAAPYPEHDKLQRIPAVAALGDAAETLNANADKINRLLFTHLDYAAIARRS